MAVTKEAITGLQSRIATLERVRQGIDKDIAVATDNRERSITALKELGVDVTNDTAAELEVRVAQATKSLEAKYEKLELTVTKSEAILNEVADA